MFALQKVVVLSTIFLSALATPTHHHSHEDDDVANWNKFSALLDTVDEVALHRVLHAIYPKFKDGVFSRDRTAAEQVHSENPVMASKLVHIAKRQASNETFPIPSPTTTTTPSGIVITTTSRSTTLAPSPSTPQQSSEVSASSSRQQEISSAINSAINSLITATTVPPRTSVLVPPTTPESATAVSTNSGGVVYSSAGGGVVTVSSSAVDIRFEPSTSTRVHFTTLPDGDVQTLTDVVTLNVAVTETAGSDPQASESAGLQGAAVKTAVSSLALVLAGGMTFWVAAIL